MSTFLLVIGTTVIAIAGLFAGFCIQHSRENRVKKVKKEHKKHDWWPHCILHTIQLIITINELHNTATSRSKHDHI